MAVIKEKPGHGEGRVGGATGQGIFDQGASVFMFVYSKSAYQGWTARPWTRGRVYQGKQWYIFGAGDIYH